MPLQREAHEQATLFRFLAHWEAKYPDLAWINASANGMPSTPLAKARMSQQGMKKGIWDIQVIGEQRDKGGNGVGIYFGLFIEMKIKPNPLTKEQKEFRRFAEARNYKCVVCYSWLEAAASIGAYLGIDDRKYWDALQ